MKKPRGRARPPPSSCTRPRRPPMAGRWCAIPIRAEGLARRRPTRTRAWCRSRAGSRSNREEFVRARRPRLRQDEGRRRQAGLQGRRDDGRNAFQRDDAFRPSPTMKTRNVVGVVPRHQAPRRLLLYTAHWDHLGVKPDVAGADKIYNGAVDNGMGSSAILELAEAFAKDKRPQTLDRLHHLDAGRAGPAGLGVFRRASDLAAEPYRRRHQHRRQPARGPGARHGAGRQRRLARSRTCWRRCSRPQAATSRPIRSPRRARFYRSDHISLSKVGVPMLYPGGGYDLIDGGTGGRAGGARRLPRHRYHQPTDELIRTGICRAGRGPGCVLYGRRQAREQRRLAELVQGQRVPRHARQEHGREVASPF